MTKKKTKARKMNLRQRLRSAADDKLTMIEQKVLESCRDAVAQHSQINPYEVMRLCCTGPQKSLRAKLITDMANEAEAELERLWNNQQKLALEETDND